MLEGLYSGPKIELADILSNHREIASEIVRQVKVLACFEKYARTGYYPFYTETFALYGQRVVAAANKMIASGQVKMMHLHASKYDDSYPDQLWSDGHLPLSIPNAENMHLREIVRNAAAAGLRHIVLEIPSATAEDVRIALNYLGCSV